MIKLQSGSILLQQPEGELEFLDVDHLHDCLWSCCRRVGIDDPELPSDIMNVVTTFSEHRRDLKGEDVDQLITKILADSGLRELAVEFAKTRKAPVEPADEMIRPTRDGILATLRNDPFFLAKPLDQLTTMVLAELERLSFTCCTRALITELARNTWYSLEAPQPADETKPYWLISRQEMPKFFHGEALRLLTTGIVLIHSISSLLPAILMRIDLVLLARSCGGDQMPELALYPRLEDLCHELALMRGTLLDELTERLPEPPTEPLATKIGFNGMETLLHDFTPSRERARIIRSEISEILQRNLNDKYIHVELA